MLKEPSLYIMIALIAGILIGCYKIDEILTTPTDYSVAPIVVLYDGIRKYTCSMNGNQSDYEFDTRDEAYSFCDRWRASMVKLMEYRKKNWKEVPSESNTSL